MKILIVPTASREIRKTVKLMKAILEKDQQKNVQDRIVEIWDNPKSPITCADISRSGAELFINFNLAGFGQSTLADGIAFNLLDCKQIHILLKKGLPEEKYLAKQLSISLFFYCMDSEYTRYLRREYPHIPYLKAIGGWKEGQEESDIENNAEILCDIILETAKICRMQP